MSTDRLEQLYVFLKEDPNDPFVYYAIATELIRREDRQGALGYFEKLTQDFPEYVGTYYHLGKLLEQLGRKEEAIDIYREGIKRAEDARDRNSVRELKEALNRAIGYDDGFD